MTKTRIIGHRGAAGLELENTMRSFERAIASGAKIIEFDVQTTLDNYLVVCHDDNLERVSGTSAVISQLTLKELQAIPLKNGETVPLLRDVLGLARRRRVAVIVEVKKVRDLLGFCNLLDSYEGLDCTLASFDHGTLAELKKLRPNYHIYLAESHQPVAVLHEARAMKAQGIDLHYMLMNPLTYLLARLWKLDIMIYTVNNRFIVQCLMFLYPHVYICTNYPDQFSQKQKR